MHKKHHQTEIFFCKANYYDFYVNKTKVHLMAKLYNINIWKF